MGSRLDPRGPIYPDLGPAVAKFRRIRNPTWAQRQAHGAAVLDAILAKQRSAQRRTAPPRPNCASGTWHSSGDEIIKAIRQQQQSAALTYVARVRRERSPEEWRAMYERAMREKKAR